MKLVDLTNFRRKSGDARRAATTGFSKDSSVRVLAVSYTHLDVYKRQGTRSLR